MDGCARERAELKYAPYFDIDWHPLKSGAARTRFCSRSSAINTDGSSNVASCKVHFEDGSFYLCYYEHRFPIAPGTYRHILDIALRESDAV